MVGSRPQLAARQLRYLTAGDPAVLERCRPVLDASATAIHHVGDPGDAATLKLAVNTLLAVQVAASVRSSASSSAPIDTRTAIGVVDELRSHRPR